MQVDTMSEQIRNFILKHFPLARKQNIGLDDQLLERGIVDSLGVLELINYLEHEFKISVSDEELIPDNFCTISYIATFVHEKSSFNTGRFS